MRAWTFQDCRKKKHLGATKCPWSVGWLDPDGKRRSKQVGSKTKAERHARRLEGQLEAGSYVGESRKQWADFRLEYEDKIARSMEVGTRLATLLAMDHFERICMPRRMDRITTQTVDAFIAKRRLERGKKKGEKLSPATVNKDLRHLKVVLNKAKAWKFLPTLPEFTMLREPKKLVRYVTPEHFAAIYAACKEARMPRDSDSTSAKYTAGEWWQALIVMTYMTGWRVSEPLALRREDLDLEEATAITRHSDNKGKADELVPLHDVVVQHLRRIVSLSPLVFPWPHHHRTLWAEFRRIQEAAGIHLPCREKHEHTDSCYVYGFHDLRRAFATMNAETLSADALQRLMRHQSYITTQKYINMARQLNKAVDKLHVPDVLRIAE